MNLPGSRKAFIKAHLFTRYINGCKSAMASYGQRSFSKQFNVQMASNDDGHSQSAASQPDAQATTMSDGYEFSRVVGAESASSEAGFKATWVNALNERKRQLANGKVIDSYLYNNVKSTEIQEKTRADSFSYLKLPFRDDPIVADFYSNAAGRMRMGQLFQDLDALAGRIAYRHTSPAEPVIVTASVDRIYLLKQLETIVDYNVVLSGTVVWTGRSSMEISIRAFATSESLPEIVTEDSFSDEDNFLTASFTFVAKNPETHRSMEVNKLLPLNEKEWVDFRRAESHNAAKKLHALNQNLETNPPTAEESRIIHKVWAVSKKLAHLKNKPKNIVFMKDTNVKSTMFMQPQYRNRHSYMIFGGYLMRQTFELAYCAASAVSHSFPRFVCLDSTTFSAPVPVGSILHMDATVVYTEHLHNSKDRVKAILGEEKANSVTEATRFDFEPKPVNELSGNKGSLLHRPGTLIQVKVDAVVQDLSSENQTKSGSFIFSFYAAEGGDEHKTQDPKVPGYVTVVPETYSEMIEYIEGRRRAANTAMYATRFKRTSKL